jgi:2-amino-4-hydroxy-6-hydroxymethyldihydropteridine diphosphokinase
VTHVAFVGIGSNLEDPRAQVLAAFEALATLPQTQLTARSPLYRSAPIGGPPQPDYVNAVARIETGLDAHVLLEALRGIEARQGRSRGERNAPRTLDLDLLLYDSAVLATADLQVPHPRMHERRFVLAPLHDIAAEIRIPGRGRVADLLAQCSAQRLERLS